MNLNTEEHAAASGTTTAALAFGGQKNLEPSMLKNEEWNGTQLGQKLEI